MRRVALASVVLALVAVGLLAGWVWSAEEEAAAPAEEGAAAPAEAPKAEGVPAQAEAPPAGTVTGLICEAKSGYGVARRMRTTPVTVKLTESALRREDKGAKGYYTLVDVAGRATYFINTMTSWDERSQSSTVTGHMAEKFRWSDIDSLGKILLDDAMQDARMLTRRDKEEGEKQVAALKAMQGAATVEPTEETKEIAGLTCKKYTISQGEWVTGYAWVAQDVKLKVPLGRMLAYSVNENAGGLPALVQLDELEGLPVDVSLEFPVLGGRRRDVMMSFVIDKVGEANIDAAEVKVPGRAHVEEPLSGRLRSRGRRD